jgi:hypothetical protein
MYYLINHIRLHISDIRNHAAHMSYMVQLLTASTIKYLQINWPSRTFGIRNVGNHTTYMALYGSIINSEHNKIFTN